MVGIVDDVACFVKAYVEYEQRIELVTDNGIDRSVAQVRELIISHRNFELVVRHYYCPGKAKREITEAKVKAGSKTLPGLSEQLTDMKNVKHTLGSCCEGTPDTT